MRQMFDLIDGGHIRSIKPRKVFPYTSIADAIRYMYSRTHINKIVVSREASPETAKMEVSRWNEPFILRESNERSRNYSLNKLTFTLFRSNQHAENSVSGPTNCT